MHVRKQQVILEAIDRDHAFLCQNDNDLEFLHLLPARELFSVLEKHLPPAPPSIEEWEIHRVEIDGGEIVRVAVRGVLVLPSSAVYVQNASDRSINGSRERERQGHN